MTSQPIKAILFDLDDTLYCERDFFRSGFAVVANLLVNRGVGVAELIAERLEYFHVKEGRDAVFQKLAGELGFPVDWIPDLVKAFRSHVPIIQLAADAREMLPRLRAKFKLGCVTDGWAQVQRAKIASLGLHSLLDAIVVADDYGRSCWKPSAFPILKCCELLKVEPFQAIFIGDNPERDMASAHNAGMISMRIRRAGAYFAQASADAPHLRADAEITDLHDFETVLQRLGSQELQKPVLSDFSQ